MDMKSSIALIAQEIEALEKIRDALAPLSDATGAGLLIALLASACTGNGNAKPENARIVAQKMAEALLAAVETDLKGDAA